MATSAAGIAAAYATEINSCSFNIESGTRTRSRPQVFCDSVTMSSTLDVVGASSFASTASFAVPIDVTTAVIVDGVSYMPSTITGLGANAQVLTANGSSIVLVAPTPPTPPAETFTNITVTGTATFNDITFGGTATGVFDAGAY